jgi:hypothetical protein
MIEAGWQASVDAGSGSVTITVWPVATPGTGGIVDPGFFTKIVTRVCGKCGEAGTCFLNQGTGMCTQDSDGGRTLASCPDASADIPILETRLTCTDWCLPGQVVDLDSGTCSCSSSSSSSGGCSGSGASSSSSSGGSGVGH